MRLQRIAMDDLSAEGSREVVGKYLFFLSWDERQAKFLARVLFTRSVAGCGRS